MVPTDDGLINGGTDLPRLAVIVDFGVERTSGGSLLLHRLFTRYPSDRLLVIYDPGQVVEDPATFLPGVTYRPYPFRIPRLKIVEIVPPTPERITRFRFTDSNQFWLAARFGSIEVWLRSDSSRPKNAFFSSLRPA